MGKLKIKTSIFKFTIILVTCVFLGISVYNFYFSNRILKGVYLNNINFSLLTKQEAINKIDELILKDENLHIKVDEKDYTVPFANLGMVIDSNQIYKKLFSTGRENFFSHYVYLLNFIYGRHDVVLPIEYNKDALDTEIANIYAFEYPISRNAYFLLENGKLSIKNGSKGKIVDYVNLKNQIISNIKFGEFYYTANFVNSIPQIKKEELSSYTADIEKYIKSPIKVENKDQNIQRIFSSEELLSIIEFSLNGKEIKIIPNKNSISHLSENIALEFNREEKALQVDIKDNEVVFGEPVDGIKVNEVLLEQDLNKFVDLYFKEYPESYNIELFLTVTKPDKTDNKYGIKELIGEGVSFFKGSITARVNNIVTASKSINGTLIAPGEEFSFVKAVGPIDASHGFDTAYIISQGRTILGTGGGVCQVSTTVFRAALNSGLPITKRTAHAYRVYYYEQNSEIGQDATIYQPSVDFRFKNDTANNVLLTASVDRKNYTMSIKLWGTKDGRVAEVSKSKILSQTPPPATIYEDTTDLPKGKLVQMEHSAWGAKVVFTRIVKDKNGKELINEEFKSNYVPWPAVYRRGI